MENVFLMEHPLIRHKISMLRDKRTGTNEFRKLVEEIAVLMGYEAFRDLPVEQVQVETPMETCMTPMISGWSGRRWRSLSIRKSCGCAATAFPGTGTRCLWS